MCGVRHHSRGERVEGEEVSDLPRRFGVCIARSLYDIAVHNVGAGEEPMSEVSLGKGGRQIKLG